MICLSWHVKAKSYFSSIVKPETGTFFPEIGHLGLLFKASSFHLKHQKAQKLSLDEAISKFETLENFLKETFENVMSTFEKACKPSGIMGTVFCSHDTWGIESSRAAVKGTKPKLQDRRVHLPHFSTRKLTCNGSLQRAVSIFTAVCTKSRQYRVWGHKKTCAVGGVLLHSLEIL